jgi:hypothetical protein
LRLLRDRKAVESRLAACLCLNAPGIFRKPDYAAGAFHLHRFAGYARGKRGAEPASPPRRFDKRKADALRRRGPKAGISDCGDRYSNAGQAENPRVIMLSGQIACSFSRGIANVAKDE